MSKKRIFRPVTAAKYGLNYIAMLLFVFIIVFPFFWILSTSFKTPEEVLTIPPKFIPDTITFENYLGSNRGSLAMYTKNSIITSGLTVLLTITMATLASYVISFLKYRFNKTIMSVFVVIQIMPIVTAIVPLFMMFRAMGLINTRLSLILTYSASGWGIPIAVILLTGYLSEIPTEIFEAAKIDGCSTFGIFWRIVLRLGMPGIVTTAIYVFIAVWQELLIVYRLITRESLRTLPPGLESFVGQYTTDWGGLMATSVVIAVPAMILFLAVQKYFINNLAGAVKG